jgi:osmotically-inducible protein OsmY/gas vesicle protein
MKHPRTDNTLALLGGAALGAVAMYLLDPDAGQRRRRQLAESTGDAAHRAGDALTPAWERVTEAARRVGGNAGSVGHGIMDRISEKLSTVSEDASRAAHDLGDKVAEKLHTAGPAHWFTREEPSHARGYAATGAGTLVLGAGLMYLLDPQRGRARRAQIIDQASSIIGRTAHTFRQIGRDLGNRARGYAHEARATFETEDAVSAEQLLQRIRSEIGHACSHASAIQVMTDNQGRVTLHGKVLASEADKVLSTIKRVSGVNEVVNLLSVKDTEQQMHAADTTSAAVRQF